MRRLILSFVSILILLTGCGISKKTTSPIVEPQTSKRMEFSSSPQGASVYYRGKYLGQTPFSADVRLNYNVHVESYRNGIVNSEPDGLSFVFLKEGYQTDTVCAIPQIERVNYKVRYPFGDGEFIFNYQEGVHSVMKPLLPNHNSAYKDDPTIVAGEADSRVSRDNPGRTALERTIIRWYFDSEPRGARVFWRVISSVPNEVKNTNESYLGTTPFEQTRSFNILGLTYQNSRDVEIEVKLTCPGYIEQVKRFNVRQAIDQAEISSFFDLVVKK